MFVTNSNGEELRMYFDLAKTTFKEKHGNHKASFNNRDRMKEQNCQSTMVTERPR